MSSKNQRINAQFLNDEFCGNKEVLNLDYRKKPWKGKNQFLFNYLKKIDYKDNKDSIRFLVPIKFWLYRNNDGSGGASDEEIKVLMTDLNYYQKLNNTGFRYYIREIEYINKTKRLKLGYFVETPLQTIIHKTKGCINIYVTDFIKKTLKGTPYLVRGTYNIATKSVILQRNTSNTGLTHEIGHYFGLLHPHRNYKSGKSKQESVSRTRTFKGPFKKGLICERNGDGLADTPAEPRLNFLVDNNCNFSGHALTDNWGDHYQSETSNIMSYPTHYRCRNSFTLNQKAVMLYNASKNKYAKKWNTNNPNNEIYRFDIYEPDNTMGMASLIKNQEIQEHTFHKICIPWKKESGSDQIDWVKFELTNQNKKNIHISFKPDQAFEQETILSLYDANKIQLKSIDSKEQSDLIQLQVENLVSGWYFLKIDKKQPISKKLYSYTIKVEIE
ncbi:MAG: hypothetical protein ABFS35_09595 [Bacteroidota bacterium]